MELKTVLEKLRELEALVDDQEQAAITFDSRGGGHIEMDMEELADFFSLDQLPAAFEMARKNMEDYIAQWIDDDLPTLHQLDEAGYDLDDI